MTSPKSGVVLQGVEEPSAFCGMVEEIDRLGFDHLWLTDSSLHGRNCYSYLHLAAGPILLVGLFPEALKWAISHVARGAEAVGRPRPQVAVFAYGAVDEDEDAALDSARSIAAWFPQTAPHICDLAGLPHDVADRVRAGYQGGEFQEAAAAASELPDEYVRKGALARRRDRAAGQIPAALEAGADSVHVFPLGNRRMNTVRGFAAAWAAAGGQPAARETASRGGISDIEQEIP